MNLLQVKSLRSGSIVHHKTVKNADGTPARARVNGNVKTWKRSPERVRVPMKRGLYEYFYITEENMHEFFV